MLVMLQSCNIFAAAANAVLHWYQPTSDATLITAQGCCTVLTVLHSPDLFSQATEIAEHGGFDMWVQSGVPLACLLQCVAPNSIRISWPAVAVH